MKSQKRKYTSEKFILLLLFLLFISLNTKAQQSISIGLHFDPLISWFGSDISEVKNDGARPGINFGLSFNKSFTPNYSFSTGVNLVSAAGRLTHSDTTRLEPHDSGSELITIPPGEAVLYKIQYVEVPIGLKLKTNEIGYVTFFSDVGVDPKVLVGGKMDIPALDIEGEKAMEELKMLNLSYHIIAGIQYGLGGNTAAVLGIGFHNNFLDVTKDNGIQPEDKVSHKMVSIRFGINF
jgi:hypothetical protein